MRRDAARRRAAGPSPLPSRTSRPPPADSARNRPLLDVAEDAVAHAADLDALEARRIGVGPHDPRRSAARGCRPRSRRRRTDRRRCGGGVLGSGSIGSPSLPSTTPTAPALTAAAASAGADGQAEAPQQAAPTTATRPRSALALARSRAAARVRAGAPKSSSPGGSSLMSDPSSAGSPSVSAIARRPRETRARTTCSLTLSSPARSAYSRASTTRAGHRVGLVAGRSPSAIWTVARSDGRSATRSTHSMSAVVPSGGSQPRRCSAARSTSPRFQNASSWLRAIANSQPCSSCALGPRNCDAPLERERERLAGEIERRLGIERAAREEHDDAVHVGAVELVEGRRIVEAAAKQRLIERASSRCPSTTTAQDARRGRGHWRIT